MNNRRSLIPANAQIPVAIVLGILFVLLCIWRFWPSDEGVAEDFLIIATGETEVQVSLDDLRKVLADIKADYTLRTERATEQPPLPRNPFQPFDISRVESADTAGTPDADETAERIAAARETRLEALKLSATGITNGASIALINGRYYRAGETVDDFTIIKIQERAVVLQDPHGSITLRMPEVPAL